MADRDIVKNVPGPYHTCHSGNYGREGSFLIAVTLPHPAAAACTRFHHRHLATGRMPSPQGLVLHKLENVPYVVEAVVYQPHTDVYFLRRNSSFSAQSSGQLA
jgi:hypothetical protein